MGIMPSDIAGDYCAERGGTIKHSQMRFNLVNNVTWPLSLATSQCFHPFRPHHWVCRIFLGENLRSIQLYSVFKKIFVCFEEVG